MDAQTPSFAANAYQNVLFLAGGSLLLCFFFWVVLLPVICTSHDVSFQLTAYIWMEESGRFWRHGYVNRIPKVPMHRLRLMPFFVSDMPTKGHR
eukprot:6185353-Pleurochrysis_carterae.AAC.1